MRLILAFLLMTAAHSLSAQTFLDRLQSPVSGQGTVKVEESREIDWLVNGADDSQSANQKMATASARQIQKHAEQTEKQAPQPVKREQTVKREQQTRQQAQQPRQQGSESQQRAVRREKEQQQDEERAETATVDTRKKVMRGSYKVTGYRVQVFAGGNTRADRQKAESTGKTVKMNFPDQPVYVHFYSPRWICRMGNYRELSEAQEYLRKVKALGFRSATLVKGKITVQR